MASTNTRDGTGSAARPTVWPGQRVQNLLSGETMTFLHTAAESDGDMVELDVALRPLGAPGGLPHCHRVAERFEVAAGTLLVWIAGQPPQVVRGGDVVEVPARRWHFVLALGRSRARVLIRPAMRFDELLATSAAVGSGDLSPRALGRLARLLREHVCI